MASLKHIPQDYRYREVPAWATGSGGEHEYRAYCRWLAGHLLEGEFKLSSAQSTYAESESLRDRTPEGIAIILADELGYLNWKRDLLEMEARGGTSYAEIEEMERENWLDGLTDDPDIDLPFEDVKTPPEEYEQICREVEEMDRIGNVPDHADIPIRPLLALAVRKCRDASHAEDVIRLFFDTFNDSASK